MTANQIINKYKRIIVTTLILILMYLILLFVFNYFGITREQFQSFLAPLGLWGVIIAFVLQITTSLTPLPDSPLAFATMVLYGPVIGFITIFSGMFVATILNYFIAKRYGKNYVKKLFAEIDIDIETYNNKVSFEQLILLRYFSFVSIDIVSYIASFSGVSFVKFILSSFVGLASICLAQALIIAGLFSKNPYEIVVSWAIPTAIILGTVILVRLTKTVIANN